MTVGGELEKVESLDIVVSECNIGLLLGLGLDLGLKRYCD